MKRFILFILFLFIIIPVNARVISGEVEYNTKVFPSQKLSYEELKSYFYDSNNNENLNYLLRGVTELKDRKIAKFSDGSYGIQYYDNPLYSFYYSSNGKLISYIQKDSISFPSKYTKFRPDGNIVNTGYRPSEKESYIYSSDGKLLAHWKNDKCYDENNNLVMTRKIIE